MHENECAAVEAAPITVAVATGNAHKLVEIEAILKGPLPGASFVSSFKLSDYEEPEEDGDTFEANARIKAAAALANTQADWAVADDSGLIVDALGGAPGIHSARYAGVHGDDHANNMKLLAGLEGVPDDQRSARFCSVVVMLGADGSEYVGTGYCEGLVGYEERGGNGFGYDPLFLPDATPGRTMAEISPEEKNLISHRYNALMDLAAKLGV